MKIKNILIVAASLLPLVPKAVFAGQSITVVYVQIGSYGSRGNTPVNDFDSFSDLQTSIEALNGGAPSGTSYSLTAVSTLSDLASYASANPGTTVVGVVHGEENESGFNGKVVDSTGASIYASDLSDYGVSYTFYCGMGGSTDYITNNDIGAALTVAYGGSYDPGTAAVIDNGFPSYIFE